MRLTVTNMAGIVCAMESLKAWLKSQGHGSRKALAEALEVRPETISRWKHGQKRPSDPMKTALRKHCGIDEQAWFNPGEDGEG